MRNEKDAALRQFFLALEAEIAAGEAVREHGGSHGRKETYQDAGKALVRAIQRAAEAFK